MAPNQLPPLRPNSNARRGSGDPRGPSGVTLVVTQQQQATENYEKRYLICLEHLKELWLRIYELEENDRQARAEHDGNLTLLKNRVREITREMEHLRPKIPQNDLSTTVSRSSAEGVASPATPCAMFEWEMMLPADDS